MSPQLLAALLCFLAGIAFAFIRLLLAGKVSPFWVDALSLMGGPLVFASQSILGIPIK